MIILKYVVLLYVVHGFAVVIHEMGHYIIAKFLIKSWDEICIGNFFHIKCSSKVKVSPFIFSAYVGVDSEEIFKAKDYKIVLFFVMGPVMNLLISIAIIVCRMESFIECMVVIINLLYFLISLVPVVGSDLYNLARVLKYKKKYLYNNNSR